MRAARAVTHLEALARACTDVAVKPRSLFPLRVVRLHVAGPLLDGAPEVEDPPVALVADVEPDEAAWLCAPHGAQHFAHAVRLPQLPLRPLWRSARAPVENHVLHRPVLFWEEGSGVDEDALRALREGRAAALRPPDPGPQRLRELLEEELARSLRAVRAATDAYARRRWAPGKLEPVADAQHAALSGHLDLLDALERLP